jgi:hypothetical protein
MVQLIENVVHDFKHRYIFSIVGRVGGDAMRVRGPRYGRLLGVGGIAVARDFPHPDGRLPLPRNHVNGERFVTRFTFEKKT